MPIVQELVDLFLGQPHRQQHFPVEHPQVFGRTVTDNLIGGPGKFCRIDGLGQTGRHGDRPERQIHAETACEPGKGDFIHFLLQPLIGRIDVDTQPIGNLALHRGKTKNFNGEAVFLIAPIAGYHFAKALRQYPRSLGHAHQRIDRVCDQ